MKTFPKFLILLLPVVVYGVVFPTHMSPLQTTISPTPTYDPLAEPPLPEDPSDLELGRNLYWHWCMPCHGDRGQGLTDEFRAIWEPDHQNCWDRGCHGGQGLEEGFPIPTIVPGIANTTHLAHFASVQELSSYLEKTHPPQSPGSLERREYQTIALFVFTMNGRSLIEFPATAAPVPFVTQTLTSSEESIPRPIPMCSLFGIAMLLFLAGKENNIGSTNL
jgi:hypothetical protein